MESKTMTNEIEGTARAKFFSNFGVETLKVRVETDGSILVWDSVARHYTRCHTLSPATEKRIARKFRQEAK
jgi:hypothetical protein